MLKPRRITVPKILNRWTITRRQAGRLELSRYNSLGLNKNYDPFVVKWILFYYQIFVRTTSANVTFLPGLCCKMKVYDVYTYQFAV